jgi:pyridoxal phosphate enzyme (YggS family)
MQEAGRIADNLARVRADVARAAERCGRSPAQVGILAVTKTFPRERVQAACEAGLRLFGENRVQEAEQKYREGLPPLELHLIGHLQRNKAQRAAALFSAVQSIDKVETAQALEAACAAGGRKVEILLEMNTSGESTKFGFDSEEALLAAADPVLAFPHLRLRGLMTVGPLTGDREAVRAAFRRLARLLERLRSRYPDAALEVLSMGMSGDYEMAVEEGSTLLRLGTALFGPRGQA